MMSNLDWNKNLANDLLRSLHKFILEMTLKTGWNKNLANVRLRSPISHSHSQSLSLSLNLNLNLNLSRKLNHTYL
jgi:hypothetical protein